MSDLCLFKLKDISWEEIGDDECQIVPHTGGKRKGYSVESNTGKRPQCELTLAESTVDHKKTANNVAQGNKETSSAAVREEKETMLEKGPWSHSSDGAFSASLDGDTNKKTLCSTSDEDRTSNQCMSSNMDSICSDSCAEDSILGDQPTAVDNNLFYQLNNANHAENDLGLLGDNLPDKESSDLLYYSWPEIENFEEVDRMFRSCDSTFGLDVDNDNDLGWLPSSHEIEGSNHALKSSFSFSGCDQSGNQSASQLQDAYGSNDTGMLKNETDQKHRLVDLKKGSQDLVPDGSCIVMSGPGTVTHVDDDSQIHSCNSELEQQKPSEGKRNGRSSDEGDTFVHFGNIKQVGVLSDSLDFQTCFSAENHEQHNTTCQTNLPVPVMNDHLSNQALTSPRTSSETSGLASLSLRDCSYALKSQQMQSMESAQDLCLQNPAVLVNNKKDLIHQRRLSGHVEKSNLIIQRADSDLVSSQKPISNIENEVEGLSEVNATNLGIPEEMDASNLQESSSMSSVVDEVSIKASSFQQLQQVMEQLDIRTKLCIRDSLYRLARSAEQRHKCSSQNIGGMDYKDGTGALISDETKCAGFMDMETETNPIDRSIAHLLFHRPSDPSGAAALDAVPTEPYPMVQTPSVGPLTAEKSKVLEETTPTNK